MKLIFPTLCAALLTLSPLSVSAASAAPATPLAASMATNAVATGGSGLEDLVQVQRRHYYDHRRGARPQGLQRGHRGDRHRWQHRPHRPPVHHHRRSSGPDLGSAVLGAIVGGVIVNQFNQPQYRQPAPPRHGSFLSSDHLNWCHNRWRSYRVSDNSYQPYNGPRRVCVSPYGPT